MLYTNNSKVGLLIYLCIVLLHCFICHQYIHELRPLWAKGYKITNACRHTFQSPAGYSAYALHLTPIPCKRCAVGQPSAPIPACKGYHDTSHAHHNLRTRWQLSAQKILRRRVGSTVAILPEKVEILPYRHRRELHTKPPTMFTFAKRIEMFIPGVRPNPVRQ